MRLPLLVGALVAAPALAACTENAPSSSGGAGQSDAASARTLTVSSTEDACDLSATQAPAGTLTFDVANAGTQVTEFYLLGEDGLRIVGEVENIGPALDRQLVDALVEYLRFTSSALFAVPPGAGPAEYVGRTLLA